MYGRESFGEGMEVFFGEIAGGGEHPTPSEAGIALYWPSRWCLGKDQRFSIELFGEATEPGDVAPQLHIHYDLPGVVRPA